MPTSMSTTSTSCFLEEDNDDATDATGSSSSCSTMTTTTSSSSLMLLKLNQAQAQIRRHHKRPSSPFDCQSLQSSLKRVRLSCSPGELRLQRDLQSLPRAYGWQQIAEDRWRKLGLEEECHVGVELHLLDPLRLVLYLKRDQHHNASTTNHTTNTNTSTARLWIQIPRMYPHRPPAVSRIENLWMERIVVHEAPPMQPPEEQPSEDATSFGTTVVYNQWSPVLHLGDLLDFLLETTAERPAGPINTRRTQPMHHTMNMNQTFNMTMNQTMPMNPPNFCTSPTHANVGFFMEEHKMEDVANASSSSNYNKYRSFLSPNRFDVGYGKYMDPSASASSPEESQPQHHSMDVN